jgi:hypothetical protein
MSVYTITNIHKITEEILAELADGGATTNCNGDRVGSYYTLIDDEEGNCVLISVTEEKDDLVPERYYYSVHLVDNITGSNCEMFFTDNQTKESLHSLIKEISDNTIDELKFK